MAGTLEHITLISDYYHIWTYDGMAGTLEHIKSLFELILAKEEAAWHPLVGTRLAIPIRISFHPVARLGAM